MKYNVTIGIPVFNVENYIERTMKSALAQSYPNIEFLVVDDGSTDDSVNIVEGFLDSNPRGKDINIIRLSENHGPSYARNQIIKHAQGEFLFFMDSDDVIREDTISLLMKYVNDEHADVVFGSLEKITLSGERVLYQYPELHFSIGDDFAVYSYRKYAGIQASACNFLFRVSVVRDNHLYFYDSNYWEDFVFVLDLVTCFSRAVLLPDITYTYLCRPNSLSNFQRRDHIDKSEVLRNIGVAEYMKENSINYKSKPYYPQRCYVTAMTFFYIACSILKQRHLIIPQMTKKEIKSSFSHPATFSEIIKFKQCCYKNLFLFFLGKMPSSLFVVIIWIIGKQKKLI